MQAALTVEGKIGNFDLTYAFAHLKRDDEVDSDYSDYSFWYDTLYAYGGSIYNDNGDLINPSQYIQGTDGYKKTSHELRIASPQDNRLRFVGGLFWQTQKHDIQQDYQIDGLAADSSVPGWPDTLWLTKQIREDHDEAVFGELSFDFTDKLTATAGFRHFRVDNTLKGFLGFAATSSDDPDDADRCVLRRSRTRVHERALREHRQGRSRENDTVGKFNLTYQFNDNKMVYATWSEGYRPGGNNRRGSLPPYVSDYLTNYELGWKTTWMDNRLTFNGAVFRQEWKDFQFCILGANGLTEIKNANQAQIDGLEMELNWAATYNLQISGGAAFYDAKLTENFCGCLDGEIVTDCPAGSVIEGRVSRMARSARWHPPAGHAQVQGQPHRALRRSTMGGLRRLCAGRGGACRRAHLGPARGRTRDPRRTCRRTPPRISRPASPRTAGRWICSSATRSTNAR